MADLNIEDTFKIAENDHGYEFWIGRIDDHWVGMAKGETDEGTMLFLFPEFALRFPAWVTDRRMAIRMTGAIAQDPENAYGGVARWFVPEYLRGN